MEDDMSKEPHKITCVGDIALYADSTREALVEACRSGDDERIALSSYRGYYWDKWRQTVWYSAAPFYFCAVTVYDRKIQSKRSEKEISVPLFAIVGRPDFAKTMISSVCSLEKQIVDLANLMSKENVGNRAYERDKVIWIAGQVCNHLESSCKQNFLANSGFHDIYDNNIRAVTKAMTDIGNSGIGSIVSNISDGSSVYAEDAIAA